MSTHPQSIHRLGAALLAALGLGAVSLPAQAAEDDPLTIVVPYPPGGSTDNSARIVQKAISPLLDRPVIVENRPGAAGNIGAAHVASLPADADSILLATQPIVTLNPHLYSNLAFDALEDLTPIINGYSGVVAIAAHPSVPADNIAELLDYARENPGELNYGTSGAGSGQHIMMVLLGEKEDVEMVHVPYRGGGPMVNDLVAGHIQLGVGTVAALKSFMDNGTVKILATTGAERFDGTPEIPALNETVPGLTLTPWMGYFGPPNMPADKVAKIGQAISQALEQKDVIQPLYNMGLEITNEDAATFAADIREEYQTYGEVIRNNNISLD